MPLDIAELVFSGTWPETDKFPDPNTNPGVFREELQRLHNETLEHINAVLKPALVNLGGRVLLPVPEINTANRPADTISLVSLGSNVASFIAATVANTFYEIHDGAGAPKYLAKDFTLSKKSIVVVLANVGLNITGASATVYTDVIIRQGTNTTDPVSGNTQTGIFSMTPAIGWVPFSNIGIFVLDPGTYKAWVRAKADNNGGALKAASGTLTIIPLGITGT